VQGRATQGKRIDREAEDDPVVEVARVASERDDGDEGESNPGPSRATRETPNRVREQLDLME
jgi:hypothetical protein